MKSFSSLVKEMQEEDRSVFLDTLRERRSNFDDDEQFKSITDMLESAFVWKNTKQGHEYWNQIANKYRDNDINTIEQP